LSWTWSKAPPVSIQLNSLSTKQNSDVTAQLMRKEEHKL
jgi:hypothetical protein